MKALVADDDLASRLVLEDVLARFGTVDACADGSEAVRAGRLALEKGEPYDLICMDLMMPSMTGLDAIQLIREEEQRQGRQRTAKVIVITGSEDSDSVTQAFRRFCDAYIVKPVDTEEFLNVVECLCEIDRYRK
jgi:two-component system, chemotaxis family, chemotaxis protein CheY